MSAFEKAGWALLLAPHVLGALVMLVSFLYGVIPCVGGTCIHSARSGMEWPCPLHDKFPGGSWAAGACGGGLLMHFGWLMVWGFRPSTWTWDRFLAFMTAWDRRVGVR